MSLEYHAPIFTKIQLHHAIQTQAKTTKLQLTDHMLIQSILMEKDKKGMIFRCYNILLNQLQDSSRLPCRNGWENDVGAIDGESWDLCLSAAPLVSVSASQRLSHLYLLHRAYRTPLQLYKRGLRDSPLKKHWLHQLTQRSCDYYTWHVS